uniref:NADH-ubiquinone oxidoreductase chain 3 n=1 Tax=Trigonopterus kotamobagensis TaxID=2583401 RepID=A0A7H1KI24_9CUCU|nr:NADH dehydrogenase subunit 3 [Trigonopterus kotamobagensis]QNT26940.1 NADH dehydrogenase subunit 3 [Trigonopterus kotamobagensis]
MKTLIVLSILIILILLAIILILNMMSKKTFYDREKNSPFECGFDPLNPARLPFSLQFFLVALIFVIFDVELALLLPSVSIMKTSNLKYLSISLSVFILILLLGLFHEQNQGSLNWIQ